MQNWGEPELCREILSERKKMKEKRKRGKREESEEERKRGRKESRIAM